MYPYGTGNSRCRTSEFGRRPAQCPTLLRLDSVGEVTSDTNLNDSEHKQQKSSMGMSTLMNKGNFFGRQSLCVNRQHNNKEMSHFDKLSYTCSVGKDSRLQVPKMEMPLFGVLAGYPTQEKTFNKDCTNIPNRSFHLNAQCFQFHPSIKSSFAYNPTESTNATSMENSQKKIKTTCTTSGCYKNFSGPKKKNRYNRYNWQLPPKPDKTRVPVASSQQDHEKIKLSSVPKQKHTVKVCVKLQQENSQTSGNEEDCDTYISTQMGHLSLGEKVAMENGMPWKKNTALKTDTEPKTEIDWFSMSRQNSEKELPSLSLMKCEDEDSDDNLCNISDEVRDLFSSSDSQSKPCDVMERIQNGDEHVPEIKLPEPEQAFHSSGNIIVKKTNSVTETEANSDTCKNERKHSEESKSVTAVPMVLYVRDNKKGRSSKRNRRRREKKSGLEQHAKNTTNHTGSDLSNKKRKFDIYSETYHSASSSSSPLNVHSFLIAFNDEEADSSDDGEIDWSEDDDDDNECDTDFLSVPSFTCPFNMNVICAVSRPESPKSSNTELDAVNSAWKINIQLNTNPTKQSRSDKKVHFPSDDSLTEVHTVEEWCRKGQWEEFARDRMRFAQRITDLETIISPVLQADHRQKVRNLLSASE